MVSGRDLCLSHKMPLMNDGRMKKEYDQIRRKSVLFLREKEQKNLILLDLNKDKASKSETTRE